MCETFPAVFTRELVAGTGSHGAIFSGESERARAGEIADAVHAGAGVSARVAGAIVDVCFAAKARETGATSAHDSITEVQTLSTVSAGVAVASVDSLLAV